MLTLAAGVGSRWTQGAGVVKALHPFCKMQGDIERFWMCICQESQDREKRTASIHTHCDDGYMTDEPIRASVQSLVYPGSVIVSRGQSVGLRMVPTARDLHFAWEEMPQQLLDEQQEKMRQSVRPRCSAGRVQRARRATTPTTCRCSVCIRWGHWYEVPNLMRGGVLQKLLREQTGDCAYDVAQRRYARRGARPARACVCT